MIVDAISVADRGFLYGDGLFETIALLRGKMPFWDLHFQRLTKGCLQLKIPSPNEQELLHKIDLKKGDHQDAVIKIIITRGSSNTRGYAIPKSVNPTYVVQCFSWPHYPKDYYSQGIKTILCKTKVSQNSDLAGIKHLNRLDSVMASSEWDTSTIAEGLMLDHNEYVIQGTKSNLFCVLNGQLYTPILNQAGVSGVMRALILTAAKEMQIPLHIQPIEREQLLKADEVFITNSLIRIWPVKQIDAHCFTIGPLTKQLLQHFDCK